MRKTAIPTIVFLMLWFVVSCASVPKNVDSPNNMTKKSVFEETSRESKIFEFVGTLQTALVLDFWFQIFIHEGSHALVGKIQGWETIEFSPYPHIKGDKFFFGSTVSKKSNYNPEKHTRAVIENEQALTLISPKISDLLILGSYSLVEENDWLPQNMYAQVILWSIAAGAWIDLVHDVCSGICNANPSNDLVLFEQQLNINSLQGKLYMRGSIVFLAAISYYPLFHGMYKILNPIVTEDSNIVTEDSHNSSFIVLPGYVGYEYRF